MFFLLAAYKFLSFNCVFRVIVIAKEWVVIAHTDIILEFDETIFLTDKSYENAFESSL